MMRPLINPAVLLFSAFMAQSVPQTPDLPPAQSQNAQLQARLQSRLDSLHRAGRFPGGTFAVVLANGTVVSVATGKSDTARGLPMKPTDRMPQGSVGKTYVSALAMQLVHEGKLNVSAPISQYLSGESWFARLPNGQRITVRHLMTHTSGLVRYEFNPRFTADLTSSPPDRIWNPRELIGYMFGSPPPFAPGEGWEYSDTNFMVLGIILEKLTGRPMIEEIRTRFISKLGLQETVPNLSPLVPGIVQGYAGASNPFGGNDAMLSNGRFSFNPQFEWAGGGWSSTSADLARWGKALYEWKAFDSTLSAAFLEGVQSRLGPGIRYGLGVMMWTAPANAPALGASLGHSGFFPGYQTELRYYTAHRIAAAFQVNSSNGRVMPQGMNMASAIAHLSALVLDVPRQ